MFLKNLALISLLISCIFCRPASAADNPAADGAVRHAGGLVCVSLQPSRDRPSSCDALCAGKGAVCTGVTLNGALNPGIACGTETDPKYLSDTVASCRCCALAH